MTRPKRRDASAAPCRFLTPPRSWCHPTLPPLRPSHPCWNTAHHRLERTPRLTSPPWNSHTSTDVLSSRPPTTLTDEWLDATHFATRVRVGLVRRLHRFRRDHPTSRGSIARRLRVPRLLDLGHRTWTVRVCVSLLHNHNRPLLSPVFGWSRRPRLDRSRGALPTSERFWPPLRQSDICHQSLVHGGRRVARDLRDRLLEHSPAAGRRGRGSAHNWSGPASLGTRHGGDGRPPSARLVVR